MSNVKEIVLKALKDKRFVSRSYAYSSRTYRIFLPYSVAVDLCLNRLGSGPAIHISFKPIKEILEKEIGEFIDGEIKGIHAFYNDGLILEFRVEMEMEPFFSSKMGYGDPEDIPYRPEIGNV